MSFSVLLSSRGLVGGRNYNMHSWLLPLVPRSTSEIFSIPCWTSCWEKKKPNQQRTEALCAFISGKNSVFWKLLIQIVPVNTSSVHFSLLFFSGVFSLPWLKIEEWLKFFNSNYFVLEILPNQLKTFFSRMLILHRLVWFYTKMEYLLLFIWMSF